MKQIITFTIAILCFMVGTARAEEIAWGEPVDNLRVGVVLSPQEAALHQPLFDVLVHNVGKTNLILPDAGSYRALLDDKGKGVLVQPLAPGVLGSFQKDARVVYRTVALATLPPRGDAFTLKPGESRRFERVPLEQKSLANGDNHRIGTWYLIPGSTNTVVFHFENRERRYRKSELWTGRATSGELKVTTTPNSLHGVEVQGGFSLPKQEYCVGELIEADFVVTNQGKKSFEFPTGGDFRGRGRHDRHTVIVTDEAGQALPDPVKPGFRGGGPGNNVTLEPGKSYRENVPLNLWCTFNRPGRYFVTCRRSLNLVPPGATELDFIEDLLPSVTVETRLTVTVVADATRKQQIMAGLPTLLRTGRWEAAERARNQFYALTLAGDADVVPFLLEAMQPEGDYTSDIIGWLRRFPGHKAAIAPALVRVAQGKGRARVEAMRLLVAWQSPDLTAMVNAMLKSNSAEERQAGLRECSQYKLGDCFETLLAMTNDPDAQVRYWLCNTLGIYRDARAVPVLLKLMRDPASDDNIRAGAADALNTLGRREGIPFLIELLRLDPARPQRLQITITLQKITNAKLDSTEAAAWLEWWEKTGKAQQG